MLDFLPTQRSTLAAVSGPDVGDAPALHFRSTFLHRVRASLPREWVPIARRGFNGVSSHLPAGLRNRLFRLAGTMSREMGAIEQRYASWVDRYDRVDESTRRQIMASIARMPQHPRISVIMPVFNPAPHWLRAAILSVQDQFYPWWELCIADDASTDPAVIQVLMEAQAGDHRIKLVRRDENGHISAASNSALKLATGSFVALLDHDDVLAPHALYEIAALILAQPDVDLIYSDEDHIGADGERHHPYFKPDWDPELNLGQNLVSHLGVYRRELVEKIGGFRQGLEGSQDHDLALRVAAETRPERIAHIPRILYHWRQGSGEQTFSEASHERCVRNARRAVQDRLPPGTRAVPAPQLPVWTRVIHPLPTPEPLVSVIIDATALPSWPAQCLRDWLAHTSYKALEVLVLNGIPPKSSDIDPRVRFLEGASINTAAGIARGTLLLLLDPGLRPADPTWVRELASQAIRPEIGAVGARVVTGDGLVVHAGIAVGGPEIAQFPFVGRVCSDAGYFGQLQLVRCVTAVSASAMMIRRQVFLDAGGLDEAGLTPPLREVDLGLKLGQLGARNIWTPYATLIRSGAGLHAAERQAVIDRRAIRLLRQRWGCKLDADAYWNPNLTLVAGEFALAFPPRNQKPAIRQAA